MGKRHPEGKGVMYLSKKLRPKAKGDTSPAAKTGGGKVVHVPRSQP